MGGTKMTYEQLEALLRDWSSMAGPETYDFVGMVHLFRACRACLQNLMANAMEADWDGARGLLAPEEREYLMRIVHHTRE